MPVEEIAEFAFRAVGRFLVNVLIEGAWELLCYFLGLWTLRVLSLGSYPPRDMTEKQILRCQMIGLAEILAAILLAFAWSAKP